MGERRGATVQGLSATTMMGLVMGVAAVTVLFFAVIVIQNEAPVGTLTRDPAVVADQPWYLGLASSLGAVGWATAFALFGFGALLVRRSGGRGARILALGSAYSLLLLIDDVYMLHDDILLRYIGAEGPVYLAYMAIGAFWLFRALPHLALIEAIPLVAGVVVLGASVAIDVTVGSKSDLALAVEDGLKFAGIWFWAAFALAVTLRLSEQALAAERGA